MTYAAILSILIIAFPIVVVYWNISYANELKEKAEEEARLEAKKALEEKLAREAKKRNAEIAQFKEENPLGYTLCKFASEVFVEGLKCAGRAAAKK